MPSDFFLLPTLLLLLSLWSTTFASAISLVNITKGNIKDKEKLGKLT